MVDNNRMVVKAKILSEEKIAGPSDAIEAKSLFKDMDDDGKALNEILVFKCVNRYVVMNADRTKRMIVAKKKYRPDKTREHNLTTVMDADTAYLANDYDFFFKWVDDKQEKYAWNRTMRRQNKQRIKKMVRDDKERRQEELTRRGISYQELYQERINARNNRENKPEGEAAPVQDGEVSGSGSSGDTTGVDTTTRDDANTPGV